MQMIRSINPAQRVDEVGDRGRVALTAHLCRISRAYK